MLSPSDLCLVRRHFEHIQHLCMLYSNWAPNTYSTYAWSVLTGLRTHTARCMFCSNLGLFLDVAAFCFSFGVAYTDTTLYACTIHYTVPWPVCQRGAPVTHPQDPTPDLQGPVGLTLYRDHRTPNQPARLLAFMPVPPPPTHGRAVRALSPCFPTCAFFKH